MLEDLWIGMCSRRLLLLIQGMPHWAEVKYLRRDLIMFIRIDALYNLPNGLASFLNDHRDRPVYGDRFLRGACLTYICCRIR